MVYATVVYQAGISSPDEVQAGTLSYTSWVYHTGISAPDEGQAGPAPGLCSVMTAHVQRPRGCKLILHLHRYVKPGSFYNTMVLDDTSTPD